MATNRGYSLTAQLGLQANYSQIRPVVRHLRSVITSSLAGISFTPKVNMASVDKAVSKLNSFRRVATAKTTLDATVNTHSIVDAISKTRVLRDTANQAKAEFAGIKATVPSTVRVVSQGIAGATKETRSFAEQVAIATRRFSAFAIGSTGIFLVGSALRSAAKDSIAFESSIARIAQVGNVSIASLAGLTKQINTAATTFGVSRDKISEGLLILKQSGLDDNVISGLVDTIAKTQLTSTFNDLQLVTKQIVLLNQVFKQITPGEFTRSLSQINLIAQNTAISAEDISTGISKFGSSLVNTGGDLQDAISLISVLGSASQESAETVGTSIRSITNRLQRLGTIDMLKSFGVNLEENGRFIGVIRSIEKIAELRKQFPQGSLEFQGIAESIAGNYHTSRLLTLLDNADKLQPTKRLASSSRDSITPEADIALQTMRVNLARVREGFKQLFDETLKSQSLKTMVGLIVEMSASIGDLGRAIGPLVGLLPTILGGLALRKLGGLAVAGITGAKNIPSAFNAANLAAANTVPQTRMGIMTGGTQPIEWGGQRIQRASSLQDPKSIALAGEAQRKLAAIQAVSIARETSLNSVKTQSISLLQRFNAGLAGFVKRNAAVVAGGVGLGLGVAATFIGEGVSNAGNTKTGGAISGAGQGALAGGLIGSYGGPMGTALGTALGGLVGAIAGYTAAVRAETDKFIAGKRQEFIDSPARLGMIDPDKLHKINRYYDRLAAIPANTNPSDKLIQTLPFKAGDLGLADLENARKYARDNFRTYDEYRLNTGGLNKGLSKFPDQFGDIKSLEAADKAFFDQRQATQKYTAALIKLTGDISAFSSSQLRLKEQTDSIYDSMPDNFANPFDTESLLPNFRLDRLGSRSFDRSVSRLPLSDRVRGSLGEVSAGARFLPKLLESIKNDASLSQDTFQDLVMDGLSGFSAEFKSQVRSALPESFDEFHKGLQSGSANFAQQLMQGFSGTIEGARELGNAIEAQARDILSRRQKIQSANREIFEGNLGAEFTQLDIENRKRENAGLGPQVGAERGILDRMVGTVDGLTREFNRLQTEFAKTPTDELAFAIQTVNDKMRILANNTSTLASIQAKLSAVENEKAETLGFGQNFFSMGVKERFGLAQDILAARTAFNAKDGLSGLSVQNQQSAIRGLQAIQGQQNVFGSGKTGKQLMEEILQKSGINVAGLNQQQNQLQNQEIEERKKILAAQQALVGHTELINNNFIQQYNDVNQQHVSAMAQLLGQRTPLLNAPNQLRVTGNVNNRPAQPQNNQQFMPLVLDQKAHTTLNTFQQNFGYYVNQLQQIKIPERIELTANIKHEHIFNGTALVNEMFGKIKELVEDHSEKTIMKFINPIDGSTREAGILPNQVRNRR